MLNVNMFRFSENLTRVAWAPHFARQCVVSPCISKDKEYRLFQTMSTFTRLGNDLVYLVSIISLCMSFENKLSQVKRLIA